MKVLLRSIQNTHKSDPKGYFDKLANKTLTKEFLKLI